MAPWEKVAMAQRRKLKPDSDIIETLKTLKSPAPSTSQIEDDICSRSMVVGRLTFCTDGRTIDCAKVGPAGRPNPPPFGRLIPRGITDMKSDALFVLLVTNDWAFMSLSQESFYDRFPCIVVHAPFGQLDQGTQLFFNKIKMHLNLPIFALGGCDPNEFTVILAYGADFWLGIRPSDLDKYEFPKNNKIRLRMKKNDVKIVTDLLKKEDFAKKNPGWVEELNLMVKTMQMCEMEALGCFGSTYFVDVFLPLKLQEQDWI